MRFFNGQSRAYEKTIDYKNFFRLFCKLDDIHLTNGQNLFIIEPTFLEPTFPNANVPEQQKRKEVKAMSRLNKANLSNKNYFGFYFFGFAYYFGKAFRCCAC